MSQTGGYGTGSRRAARRSGASFGGTQESLSSAPMAYISGKQAFLEILKSEGVAVMFGNPGTTELPLMDGLAREPGIHYVLALQEAVAIAAADGYAQARGGLAAVNVHVTPGLGNAMGMLYDAQKSGAPLLLTAGQHDQSFTVTEPILWADLPPIARPFVKWSTEARRLEDLPRIVRRAAKTALARPSGPVFLSLPVDVLNAERDLDLGAPTRVAPRLVGDRAAGGHAAPRPADPRDPDAPRPARLRRRRPLHALAARRRGPDAARSRRRPPRRGPLGARQELPGARRDPGRPEGDAARAHGGAAPPRRARRRRGGGPARARCAPLPLFPARARRGPPDVVVVEEAVSSSAGVRTFFRCADPKSFFGLRGGGIGWGMAAAPRGTPRAP